MNLGIDLGTTFSLAGYLNRQGTPTLVPDLSLPGVYRTPSVVHVGSNEARVGQSLEEQLLEQPGLPVARGFKRLMGSADPSYHDEAGRGWPAEALSALVLRKLMRDVEAHAAEAIERCVMTVPANFDDVQRRATRAAAQLSGLASVQLVEEPIAAAAFYGYTERDAEQTLLVYDFGGGTFDATVLQISGGRIYVLATEGDNALGGRTIDRALIEVLAAETIRRHGLDPLDDPAAAETLRRFAETAKIAMTQAGRGVLRKSLVLSGRVCEFVLAPEQIERVVLPAVARTIEVCGRCLDGAALGWSQIDRLLLVGGSSLAPQVARALAQVSGKPSASMICRQPHQAVAYGAALLAESAHAAAGESVLAAHAVAPYHLGLRVRDAASGVVRVEVLVKRNTPLPARHTATFYTTRSDQTRLVFDIVQSKNEGDVAASLGTFSFGPLRTPRRNYPLELTVAYDAEGLVRVTAKDLITGESLQREMASTDDPSVGRMSAARELVRSVALAR